MGSLRAGRVIAYPTETLYGLGVDPFQPEALERLYRLKGRPAGRPVSLLVADAAMLRGLVREVTPSARALLEAFLPGPLTLVLEARADLPAALTAGTGKIGLRISSHPLIPHLFARLSGPITTTSANPTGRPPAGRAEEIAAYFPRGVACILDGGPSAGSTGSTVVDLTGPQPAVLREGAIPANKVLEVLGA